MNGDVLQLMAVQKNARSVLKFVEVSFEEISKEIIPISCHDSLKVNSVS